MNQIKASRVRLPAGPSRRRGWPHCRPLLLLLLPCLPSRCCRCSTTTCCRAAAAGRRRGEASERRGIKSGPKIHNSKHFLGSWTGIPIEIPLHLQNSGEEFCLVCSELEQSQFHNTRTSYTSRHWYGKLQLKQGEHKELTGNSIFDINESGVHILEIVIQYQAEKLRG